MPALWWSALIWIGSGMLITIGLGLLRRERRASDLRLNAERPHEFQPDRNRFADVVINPPAAAQAPEAMGVLDAASVTREPAAMIARDVRPKPVRTAPVDAPTTKLAPLPVSNRAGVARALDTAQPAEATVAPADDRGLATIRIVNGAPPPDRAAPAWVPDGPAALPVPRSESAAERAEVLAALGRSISRIRAEIEGDPITGERSTAIHHAWDQVAATVDGAVATVNSVLASVDMEIGPAGDHRWSPRTGGYGCFRRVLIDGASVAWLRTEVAPTGRVTATVRAHKPERAPLNGQAMAAGEPLTLARAADMLAEALRPAAEETARTRTARVPDTDPATGDPRSDHQASKAAASGP